MPRQCPACSKINPEDACYCYYDGRPLSGERQDGPMKMGAMPFPMPFYFSDGQACANFNQLALACDERWEEARELLSAGYWATFFGGMGRLDLVAAAKRAATEPDRDLGLSQLLEKFPADTDALRPPKATVDSTDINLGQMRPGTDHAFELTILNQGMLVLRGMMVANCDWLVFGSKSGPSQKMFQTRNVCTTSVRVLGHKLRAGLKPVEGEIVVDTNGGTIKVPVRVDVPILPFPKGVYANDALAGAKSPHEIAVKSKAAPTDAAVLFEQGAVKAWYAGNGWTYPIDGAEGTGKGAVQQFFEALGLTKPPKLDLDTVFLTFKGKPGQRLSRRMTLSTEESKPVYSQSWSSEEWVQFGPAKYMGNKVRIYVEVVVPDRPGTTLTAQLTIQGNGKQQFVVPVNLAVEGDDRPIVVTPVEDEDGDGLQDVVRKGLRAIRGFLGKG